MDVRKEETWVVELNRHEVLDIRAILYIAYNQCVNISESELQLIADLSDKLKELG